MTDDRLDLSGSLQIRQSDFGITPVTILVGKLTVEDTLQIEYYLAAETVNRT